MFDDNPHIVTELLGRADTQPNEPAMVHLADGITETCRLGYAQLIDRVCGLAARMQDARLSGRPVLVAAAPGPDYAIAMLACFFAGAIAVPMPELRSRRWDEILKQIDPGAILVSGLDDPASTPQSIGIGDDQPGAKEWRPMRIGMEAIAFVQFTSGSTAAPKGVMISYRALAANCAMIRAGFPMAKGQTTVTWLPPWHDMGLVGALLHPLAEGSPVVTIPPLVAIQRPIRWLRAIQHYGATASGGPSFGFRNCVDRVAAADLSGLNLASWKLAYCGAEPVREATLQAFARKFAPSGFDPASFLPCYGLAEATLFVTGAPPGGARSIVVDAAALRDDNIAKPAAEERSLVSCGRAQAGGEILIVDSGTGLPLPDSAVGEIVVTGPHVASGYWGMPDHPAFGGDAAAPRVSTGDLGFLLDGELYVAGRMGNVIIVRGIKHHAEDIEQEVLQAHPLLAHAAATAFSIDDGAAESVVIMVELPRSTKVEEHIAIEASIQRRVLGQCGFRPNRLLLVKRGTLPRTTSGKVERHRCRAEYGTGAWPAELLLPVAQCEPVPA